MSGESVEDFYKKNLKTSRRVPRDNFYRASDCRFQRQEYNLNVYKYTAHLPHKSRNVPTRDVRRVSGRTKGLQVYRSRRRRRLRNGNDWRRVGSCVNTYGQQSDDDVNGIGGFSQNVVVGTLNRVHAVQFPRHVVEASLHGAHLFDHVRGIGTVVGHIGADAEQRETVRRTVARDWKRNGQRRKGRGATG